jgi:hypothetical protein
MRGLDGMWWKMRWQEFPASLARPVRVILQQNVLQQEIELGPWEFEKHQFVFVATNPETDPSRQLIHGAREELSGRDNTERPARDQTRYADADLGLRSGLNGRNASMQSASTRFENA